MIYSQGMQPVVCKACGFAENPTFRKETRVSHQESGNPEDGTYLRALVLQQVVLSCLKCAAVYQVLEEARGGRG